MHQFGVHIKEDWFSDIHPEITDIYRRKMERLAEALNKLRGRDEVASATPRSSASSSPLATT